MLEHTPHRQDDEDHVPFHHFDDVAEAPVVDLGTPAEERLDQNVQSQSVHPRVQVQSLTVAPRTPHAEDLFDHDPPVAFEPLGPERGLDQSSKPPMPVSVRRYGREVDEDAVLLEDRSFFRGIPSCNKDFLEDVRIVDGTVAPRKNPEERDVSVLFVQFLKKPDWVPDAGEQTADTEPRRPPEAIAGCSRSERNRSSPRPLNFFGAGNRWIVPARHRSGPTVPAART